MNEQETHTPTSNLIPAAEITAGPPEPLSMDQSEILNAELLESGINLVLQMPTGAGKTWLAAQAIARTLARGERVIYLTPLKALAQELHARWQPLFNALGRVGIFTGDYGAPGKPRFPVPLEDARLLLMTPERLDLITRTWPAHMNWIAETALLIVDEIHLLGEGYRGARLEGTISRFRRLNPLAQIVAMSATIGNRRELAEWLAATEYFSERRLVPLRWKILRFKRSTEKPELLAHEVLAKVATGGKSLVFVQSRRRAEELARHLCATGIRAAHHHAGLAQVERTIIEEGFRGDRFDAVVATSTLEMGLNLPASQVIIYDNQTFSDGQFKPLPVNNVWQRVGRAGRHGLDHEGEAVIVAPAWDQTAAGYERGRFEPILSGLSAGYALAEQIIVEVAAGLARTEQQLREALNQSLAAHQGRLPNVGAIVTQMRQARMLTHTDEEEEERDRLRATRLGKVAVRHMLSPETVLLFRHVFETTHELTIYDLLLVAACAEDCEVRLTVDFEELNELSLHLAQEPSYLLQMKRQELAALVRRDGKHLLSAIKMAAVMTNWTRTGSTTQTAEQYGCYAAEVDRLKETITRVAGGMAAVFRGLRYTEIPEEAFTRDDHNAEKTTRTPFERRLGALAKMIIGGIPEESASLFEVKGIGFRTARKLRAAGIRNARELGASEPETLGRIPGISERRAHHLVEEAARLAAEDATPFDEQQQSAPLSKLMTVMAWPSEIDRYRFMRSLRLEVTTLEEDTYRVTGGSEPHTVTVIGETISCDCADAEKGHSCKHSLAVRLKRNDPVLLPLVERQGGTIEEEEQRDGINLQHLWSAEPAERRRLFEAA